MWQFGVTKVRLITNNKIFSLLIPIVLGFLFIPVSRTIMVTFTYYCVRAIATYSVAVIWHNCMRHLAEHYCIIGCGVLLLHITNKASFGAKVVWSHIYDIIYIVGKPIKHVHIKEPSTELRITNYIYSKF